MHPDEQKRELTQVKPKLLDPIQFKTPELTIEFRINEYGDGVCLMQNRKTGEKDFCNVESFFCYPSPFRMGISKSPSNWVLDICEHWNCYDEIK